MKGSYEESKKYADNIMDAITEALDKTEIKYEVKSDGTEIVISNGEKTLDEIERDISVNIYIPKIIYDMLIDMVEVDGVIYIRQTTK